MEKNLSCWGVAEVFRQSSASARVAGAAWPPRCLRLGAKGIWQIPQVCPCSREGLRILSDVVYYCWTCEQSCSRGARAIVVSG